MENNHELMLDIAREVIQLRAARDGYEPGAYDTEQDPEGYLVSLLNALHQHCRRYGIDWDGGLATAQGFFEQDLADAGLEPTVVSSLPTVEDLRCPKCGQSECFVIEVSERLLMFKDGVVLHGDTGEEWGDWSYCRCHSCQYTGTIRQFHNAAK